MSTEIEWGAEIEVNGVRPVWLKDNEPLLKQHNCPDDADCHNAWQELRTYQISWLFAKAIRLPADHWAYIAINAGFEPFAGGNKAPEDWDQGEVLFGDFSVDHTSGSFSEKDSICWQWTDGKADDCDIIGYHNKKDADVSELPDDVEPWAQRITSTMPIHILRYELARMIQQFKPELKPIDKDVLAVREILAEYKDDYGAHNTADEYRNGDFDNYSPFQAALTAYKKHKQS